MNYCTRRYFFNPSNTFCKVITDPDYSSYLQKQYIFNKEKQGKGSKPVNNVYFFFSVKPAEGASAVEFKVIDPYGFSIEPYINLR